MTQTNTMKMIRATKVTEAEVKKALKRVKFGKLSSSRYEECPTGSVLVDGEESTASATRPQPARPTRQALLGFRELAVPQAEGSVPTRASNTKEEDEVNDDWLEDALVACGVMERGLPKIRQAMKDLLDGEDLKPVDQEQAVLFIADKVKHLRDHHGAPPEACEAIRLDLTDRMTRDAKVVNSARTLVKSMAALAKTQESQGRTLKSALELLRASPRAPEQPRGVKVVLHPDLTPEQVRVAFEVVEDLFKAAGGRGGLRVELESQE